jgi:hypothetical protein
MMRRLAYLTIAAAGLCAGADKKLPTAAYSSDVADVTAVAHISKDQVKELLGTDLGGDIIVVDVKLTPKFGNKLALNRDDFLLRSDKDGQKSKPFAPSQIAGAGTLVVSTRGGGAGIAMDDRGPVWGGIGGPPGRLGSQGSAIGNTSQGEAHAAVNPGAGLEKPDPLLALLTARVLPEKEIDEPVSGLLYFLMEGRHKVKDLELHYRGAAGRFSLRFR